MTSICWMTTPSGRRSPPYPKASSASSAKDYQSRVQLNVLLWRRLIPRRAIFASTSSIDSPWSSARMTSTMRFETQLAEFEPSMRRWLGKTIGAKSCASACKKSENYVNTLRLRERRFYHTYALRRRTYEDWSRCVEIAECWDIERIYSPQKLRARRRRCGIRFKLHKKILTLRRRWQYFRERRENRHQTRSSRRRRRRRRYARR